MNMPRVSIRNCTGVILAGGENTRMPVRKAFIRVNGTPIIERNLLIMRELFNEVFIVTNDPGPFAYLDAPMLGDIYDLRGPMTGIFTSLVNASHRWVFVSACDMPFLNRDLIRHMADVRNSHDAVVPRSGHFIEPLFAFYSRRVEKRMERSLLGGSRGLKDFLKDKKVKYTGLREIRLFDPGARAFINLNTPEDVKRYLGN